MAFSTSLTIPDDVDRSRLYSVEERIRLLFNVSTSTISSAIPVRNSEDKDQSNVEHYDISERENEGHYCSLISDQHKKDEHIVPAPTTAPVLTLCFQGDGPQSQDNIKKAQVSILMDS